MEDLLQDIILVLKTLKNSTDTLACIFICWDQEIAATVNCNKKYQKSIFRKFEFNLVNLVRLIGFSSHLLFQ